MDKIVDAFAREEVMDALTIMGQGMLGIFVALGVIAISVWVMQKIFKK